jgi:SAM-dependent methyltransferase
MGNGIKNQKAVFLESEGDAWFNRNAEKSLSRDFSDDPVVQKVMNISQVEITPLELSILEVGAGAGGRLEWLQNHGQMKCVQGIEPSKLAVDAARSRGLSVVQGTADSLPFDEHSFDIVIFGFCLYLCDRDDLFRIASEADRVLKRDGWIIIHDFYSPFPMARPYHHKAGVSSFKMDYRQLFDWNPAYICYSHELSSHADGKYTDDDQEWVAVSVLRKLTQRE